MTIQLDEAPAWFDTERRNASAQMLGVGSVFFAEFTDLQAEHESTAHQDLAWDELRYPTD